MTVEEYRIGQLYSVAEASKSETGGGDGVEILVNEPFNNHTYTPVPALLNGDPRFTSGQYTHKYYHLANKVPRFVRFIAPKSALIFNEYAWNAYPYCRTLITNNFMGEKFSVTIESLHVDSDINMQNDLLVSLLHADAASVPHQLTPDQLAEVEIIYIDIADVDHSDKDYVAEEDPKLFHSEKTGRGPLKQEWWKDNYNGPIMCAYKLVSCEFDVWSIRGRVESTIQSQERRLFANFHRQVFCWMDKWFGWTMDDIRKHEECTRLELEQQRKEDGFRGHIAEE